jgi:hypothetical protein
MRSFGATVVMACVLAAAGCSRGPAPIAAGPLPATAPSTGPAPTAAAEKDAPEQGGKFDRPDLGLRLDLPQGWVQRRSQDYELVLHRAGKGGDDAGAPSVSLDVPDLPPHIPGMIPIGSVRKGYLDDLRKSVGDIKTTDLTPTSIPASAERMVRSTWTDSAKKPAQETALMLVHADRVYIFRARSGASDEAATREAFDSLVRSLGWTKKGSSKGSPK